MTMMQYAGVRLTTEARVPVKKEENKRATRLKFNLSPSAINCYRASELLFYYYQIAKAESDTNVVQCYGQAGTVVHNTAENYSKAKNQGIPFDTESYFLIEWERMNLHKKKGMNGRPLSFQQYRTAMLRSIDLLDNKYIHTVIPEEKIEFPLIDNDEALINIKGLIDCQHMCPDGSVEIMDYKTSSKVGTDDSFRLQGIHYCYSVWRKKGVAPKRIIFEYVKINKTKVYTLITEDEMTKIKASGELDAKDYYTVSELKEYEKFLSELADEIIKKGRDINNYDIGDISSIFNDHKRKCIAEKNRREALTPASKPLHLHIKDNRFTIASPIDDRLRTVIDDLYSYLIPGVEWSVKYNEWVIDAKTKERRRKWDGKKKFYKNNSLPMGFIVDFIETIKDYNKHFKDNYVPEFFDKRDSKVTSTNYKTKFKPSTLKPRYYQIEAKDAALYNRHGILYLGTSAGKSLIATEIIRELNNRVIFVVNRVELLDQTMLVMEQELGVKVGSVVEGKLDINKQITVCCIQSIGAILKRGDESSKLLSTFLYNVNTCIFDEAQNLKKAERRKHKIKNDEGKVIGHKYITGLYELLNNQLINVTHCIGLSGTPFRGDGCTMEMNSLVGFPIYRKPCHELESEGFICPTKCYFIKTPVNSEVGVAIDYNDFYRKYIVENSVRNELAINAVNRYKKTKKILILTRRVRHAEQLYKLIGDECRHITGSTDRNKRKQWYQDFVEGKIKILIGSIQIFSAGIDIPDLDIVINVTGNKSDVDTIQVVGRTKRKISGKLYGYYIDFNDIGSKYFDEATEDRANALKRHKNVIKYVNTLDEVDIK